MPSFLDALGQRVLVFDGAMGTQLQALDLGPEDEAALEQCPELLNATNPDAVRGIHRDYLAAGADVVETNTFGCNPLLLQEFDIAARTVELNQAAASVARQACDDASTPQRPRFVAGSMGPGTRLPSLGQVSWAQLEASYRLQALGLIQGGVDVLLLETAQDLLQLKAGIAGIRAAQRELGSAVPIMAQVTIETTGTMLVGSDIATALTALEPMGLAAIGLNCATGPQQMAPWVAYLCKHSRIPVSVLPNAGLPELVGGKAQYPLGPDAFADWVERFVVEDGVSIVGGCCGTSPAHIRAVAERVGGRAPTPREPAHEPSISSLYRAVPLLQDADVLAIGERANANGSKACRTALENDNYDRVVELGRIQIKRGSHALDLCTAVVGRAEKTDMTEVVSRLRTQVDAPLVIDSTDPEVIRAALELLGGRSVINSVNLEEGEPRADLICGMARDHGAALVALAIDEEGMARSPERKLAVTERLVQIAVQRHGIEISSLLLDPLTFTVCTGLEDDRKLALWTLEGIRLIRQRFPDIGIVLGVSNVSFGLTHKLRPILSSVFLHHAREAGLTAAIVHARGVLPLFSIPDELREVAEDLIFDRRRPDYDPLQRFLELGAELTGDMGLGVEEPPPDDETVQQRLERRVVQGLRDGLEDDLALAMQDMAPLDIINEVLLAGMRIVGEHFAAGRTQLPFVLQSAEVVKASVSWLEPHMESKATRKRGKMVLATVRGDVHDIGKNLVEILLSNNGFEVIDLGIRQPVANILAAIREHDPDAVGLSGLLVRSTAVMHDDLLELRRQGIHTPVILGGAALNKRFVREDCTHAYGQPVGYGANAFDGLSFMEELEQARAAGLPSRWSQPLEAAPPTPAALNPDTDAPLADAQLDEPAPAERSAHAVLPLPFHGSRVLEAPGIDDLLELVDTTTLYRSRWGFRGNRRGSEAWQDEVRATLDPLYQELVARMREHGWLKPAGVYGWFPCHGAEGELVMGTPDGGSIRLTAPRGKEIAGLSGWFPPRGEAPDAAGLMAVTVGDDMVRAVREHYHRGEYRDYLLLHGLATELAEALAAWTHRHLRAELGIGDQDDPDPAKLIRGHYRGRRYAFGYPAVPLLSDQQQVLDALDAQRIGVSLTETFQLRPTLTTTAVVLHHPRARYFRV
jgi:5-methyltetrahydrofolate--homocysteine methyltransferase